MDKKVLEELQKLDKKMSTIEASMTTKADLKAFATKDDLKEFATKGDLEAFATKRDLDQRFDQLDKKIDKLDNVQWAIFRTVDQIKADKSEILKLNERVSQLEQKLSD
jgi:hypothetical protein